MAQPGRSSVVETDGLNPQGDARCDPAGVLAAASRTEEAAETLEQSLDRYQRKKNLARMKQVRPRLEALKRELSSQRPTTTR